MKVKDIYGQPQAFLEKDYEIILKDKSFQFYYKKICGEHSMQSDCLKRICAEFYIRGKCLSAKEMGFIKKMDELHNFTEQTNEALTELNKIFAPFKILTKDQ
jgi:hypothetical protein